MQENDESEENNSKNQDNLIYLFDNNKIPLTPKNNKRTQRNEKIVFLIFYNNNLFFLTHRNQSIY